MRRLRVWLAVVAFVAAVAPWLEARADRLPPGAVDLGGVNLNAYCSATYGPNYKSFLVGKTAGDWLGKLTHGGGAGKQISVANACTQQYGKSGLIADALNWNDPLSWRCAKVLGSVAPGRRTCKLTVPS